MVQGILKQLSQPAGTSLTPPSIYAGGVVATSATTFTILDSDGTDIVLATAGSSAVTVNLPAAANNSGRELIIKKVDSGTGSITVDANASETIDGFLTVQIAFQYDVIRIVCDGTGWNYVGQHYQSFNVTSPTITNAGTSPSGFVKGVRIGRHVTIMASITTGATGSPTQAIGMTTPVPTAFLLTAGTAFANSDVDASTETWYTGDLGPSGSPTFYRWIANNTADQIGTGANWGNAVTKYFTYAYLKY